jgi:hypothetical protein
MQFTLTKNSEQLGIDYESEIVKDGLYVLRVQKNLAWIRMRGHFTNKKDNLPFLLLKKGCGFQTSFQRNLCCRCTRNNRPLPLTACAIWCQPAERQGKPFVGFSQEQGLG